MNLEKSYLVLGFYLSSWGMFRGSSLMLQKSVRNFDVLITIIDGLPPSHWDIDLDSYTPSNISTILQTYEEIKEALVPRENKDLTLVTKVILGVFGFLPAFDDNFSNTFRFLFGNQSGFRVVNEKSLLIIKQFYDDNHQIIDQLSNEMCTTDFETREKTAIHYPKAKIIDMYGWQKYFYLKKHGLI
jgi:hypothetical protein